MAYEVEDYDDLMKGHFHLEYLQEQDKKNNVKINAKRDLKSQFFGQNL